MLGARNARADSVETVGSQKLTTPYQGFAMEVSTLAPSRATPNAKQRNPDKTKTLRRPWKFANGVAERIIVELHRVNRNAVAAWTWLKSHADGWRITVEHLAAELGIARSTAYEAVAVLEQARLLSRDREVWTLLLPESGGLDSAGAGKDASAGAGSLPCKDKNTYLCSDGSHVDAPSTAAGLVSMASKPTKEPTKPTPPRGAPDPGGRPEVPKDLRIASLDAFLVAWSDEFNDGPSSHAHMTLPSAWQERVVWMWRHWTRREIGVAFAATVDGCPRKGWPYFRACLERIAAGNWNVGRASGDPLAYLGGKSVDAAGIEREVKREAEAPSDPIWDRVVAGEITKFEALELYAAQGATDGTPNE